MSKPSENAKRTVVRVGDGRGFIVSAGESRYVITAAHCLPHYPEPFSGDTAENTFPRLLGPLATDEQTIWAEIVEFNATSDWAVFWSRMASNFSMNIVSMRFSQGRR